jgi:hypothetical protein
MTRLEVKKFVRESPAPASEVATIPVQQVAAGQNRGWNGKSV